MCHERRKPVQRKAIMEEMIAGVGRNTEDS